MKTFVERAPLGLDGAQVPIGDVKLLLGFERSVNVPAIHAALAVTTRMEATPACPHAYYLRRNGPTTCRILRRWSETPGSHRAVLASKASGVTSSLVSGRWSEAPVLRRAIRGPKPRGVTCSLASENQLPTG